MTNNSSKHHWWQEGVIYEAYVRSFQDSDGDGIGDLPGLRRRLPYFEWLGIDILWLTPCFKSPQKEFGYDIADYTSVDPLFGTLEDFDGLVADAHARGIRIVMDIAPNHSSDQHAWFVESRSSRDNPKRDWYIWRDGAPGGGPPNNWLSAFGGSAWELDEKTGQYYYHAFLAEQPDLNWRTPEVERAILDSFRFWLDRGVDGFRIDVMWHLLKDRHFRDNPPNHGFDPKKEPSNNAQRAIYNADRPEVIDIVLRMRNLLQEYDGERLMIGELYHQGEGLVDYYGPNCEGAQIPHNQQLILLPWEGNKLRDAIEGYLGTIPEGCWPNWVLGNHDKYRLATRTGSQAQARVAMMMLLTLRGTPSMYYGDEIGMENGEIPPDRIQDPFEKREPGKGQGRDPERTPMQWTADEPYAGFSTVEPWLPVADGWRERNVENQKRDPDSILNLTRRLLELRRSEDALRIGEHRLILSDGACEGPVIAYRREMLDEPSAKAFIVALNLSDKAAKFELPFGYEKVREVLSTVPSKGDQSGAEGEARTFEGSVMLRADEGVILQRM